MRGGNGKQETADRTGARSKVPGGRAAKLGGVVSGSSSNKYSQLLSRGPGGGQSQKEQRHDWMGAQRGKRETTRMRRRIQRRVVNSCCLSYVTSFSRSLPGGRFLLKVRNAEPVP